MISIECICVTMGHQMTFCLIENDHTRLPSQLNPNKVIVPSTSPLEDSSPLTSLILSLIKSNLLWTSMKQFEVGNLILIVHLPTWY